ncbi:MAG: hypothetical protein JST91_22130 [Actinobacteria bacterium]|nr:hypothetical protein [Actinomycetota bacterium]
MTDERTSLNQAAGDAGWEHRDLDRVDVFARGASRIRVVWQGSSVISGATMYQDDILASYTRDLSTVGGWLKR